MTGKALSLIALLALAGCQPAAENEAREPTISQSAAEPSAAPSPATSGDLIVSPEQEFAGRGPTATLFTR